MEKRKPGQQYPREAIDLCAELYCKYGGKSHDRIEREMQKAGWVGWKKGYLYDKGKPFTKTHRDGWVNKYGFENLLKKHAETLVAKVASDEQSLYLGIKRSRERLEKLVDAGQASKDEIYQYRDFCKLEIEARKNLDLTRDNFETFVSGFEKLATWLGDIDPQAAKMLVKHSERLAELAQAHYGKEDEIDSRAEFGTDESGDEPFSLIDRKQ